MILTSLLRAPLHSLGQHNQNKVQHDSLGHAMPLVPALEDNENQVQYGFIGHVTLLIPVLVSCDANGIINSTNTFVRLR